METTTKNKTSNKAKAADAQVKTGLSKKASDQLAGDLNALLADEVTLYIKTLNFHWNIVGSDFHALHIFLEEQYNELQTMIDEVAERIRKIGRYANGSMSQFLSDTRLDEHEGGKVTPEMLAELASDHDSVAKSLRDMIDRAENDYEDAGTADLMTQLLRQHEKMAWMLHATVAK